MKKNIILIVEDQPDLRKLLRVTMSLGEVEIHEAENGHAALNMMRSLRPDVVLLDVMMPGGLDGFQVCSRIKADKALRGTKVVMLTARAQASDIAMAQSCGADAYLSKPFSPLELLDKVAELTRASPVQSVAGKV